VEHKDISTQPRAGAFAAGLFGASLSLLRQLVAEQDLFSFIWAEDGWFLMCARSQGVGSCLFEPVNGYWPMFHRILAEPIAFFPLEWWSFVVVVLGAALFGCLMGVLYRSFGRLTDHMWAWFTVVLVAVMPVLGVEYINVVGNIHWALLVGCLMLIISSTPERLGSPLILMLVFSAGLSNPAGFVIVACAVLMWIARIISAPIGLRLAFAGFTGWAIQVVAILSYGGDERVGSTLMFLDRLDSWANTIVGVVPGLGSNHVTSVNSLVYNTTLSSIVLVVGVVVFLSWTAFSKRTAETDRRLAVLGLSTQLLTGFLVLILNENPRYVFVSTMLNVVWILGMLHQRIKGFRFLRAGLVLATVIMSLPAFRASSYRTTPSTLAWSTQIELARDECESGAETVTFFFAPGQTYLTEVPCNRL
jgi:hypothetical protein